MIGDPVLITPPVAHRGGEAFSLVDPTIHPRSFPLAGCMTMHDGLAPLGPSRAAVFITSVCVAIVSATLLRVLLSCAACLLSH